MIGKATEVKTAASSGYLDRVRWTPIVGQPEPLAKV